MQARSETRKISYAWLRWIAKLIQIQIYLGFRIHDCGTLSGLLLDSKTSDGTSPSIFSDCLFNHDALRGSLWLLPLVCFLLQLSRPTSFSNHDVLCSNRGRLPLVLVLLQFSRSTSFSDDDVLRGSLWSLPLVLLSRSASFSDDDILRGNLWSLPIVLFLRPFVRTRFVQ